MSALNVLCAELTRDLFAIAKFLYKLSDCGVVFGSTTKVILYDAVALN